MKRICCFLISCLTVSACLLYAADFWEKKEFTTWSKDEVSKLLRNSPWAARAEVTVSEMNPANQQSMIMEQASGVYEAPTSIQGVSIMDRIDLKYITDRYDPNERLNYGSTFLIPDIIGSGSGSAKMLYDLSHVILRWHSSLPVRQAVAVLRYIDKAGTSEKAAEMIDRQLSVYILGVIGMRLGPIPIDEKKQKAKNYVIKTGSQLIVEGKPPIRAIEVYNELDGRNDNYYLAFPRYRDNVPLISLEDKEVEVVIEYHSFVIKKKFNLKDMQYRGKLEI